MKRFHAFLPLLAAAALFTGCNDLDQTNDPAATGRTTFVKLRADVPLQNESRAAIKVDGATFSGTWENDDAMGVLFSEPGNPAYSDPRRFIYNASEFAFEGELPTGTGAWRYKAFYPHSPVSGDIASVPFGNLRTQQGNAFNCASDALVAEMLGFSNAAPGLTDEGEPVSFRLKRLTSILNLTLTGGSPDEQVRHVLLTSGSGTAQPLSAKSFDFDIARMGEGAALSADAHSDVITLSFEPGTAPGTDNLDVFFNVMPGNYDELTFEVITESKKIGKVSVTRDDPEKPFVAGKLYKKEVAGLDFETVEAPSLVWPDQDMDAVHDITLENEALTYSAAITINAPAGIAGLTVEVTSDFLAMLGISSMDIFNDEIIRTVIMDIPYAELGLDCTTQVQYKKSTVFDITNLVPMIMMGAEPNSLHIFEVHVTDLAGQQTVQALTFRAPGPATDPEPAVAYNNDADLWLNTATLTIENADAATAVLEYRTDNGAWHTAAIVPAADGKLTATIAPSWTAGQNATGTAVHTIDEGTGVFAGHTYNYRLTIGGDVKASGSFTIDNTGDAIYNAGMEHWSTYTVTGGFFTGGVVPYPNENSSTTFWVGGNNKQTNTLCTGVAVEGSNGTCAQLKPKATLGIFAAGNLFTGTFDCGTGFADTFGFARFGVQYAFTARPRALRLRYNATITKVTNVGKSDLTRDDIDRSRIFVSVVDWTGRHAVKSGAAFDVNTFWDPEAQTSVAEGPILGYGSVTLDASSNGWETLTLPINWYDQTAYPTQGNYSLVISCATSYKGDYVAGSTNNLLFVEDFEWVY